MRLLFISSFYLFPGTRFGGAKRLHYFAREWERMAELSVICMDGCREWDGGAAGDAGFGDFLMLPNRSEPAGWARIADAPSDRSRALAADAGRIREFLRDKRFDAVLLAYPWALTFAGPLLAGVDAPIHFMDDDLILEQFRSGAAAGAGPWRRLGKAIRYRQTLAFYRARLAGAAAFIGISPQEAAVMRGLFPALRCEVMKYALPLSDFPRLPETAGNVVGFIGNFGHVPNLDSLAWLQDEVMPALRAHRPDVRFLFAGRGLPAALRERLRSEPGLEWREDVADLASFYADISLLVNPARTGRGLRTKALEAAAFGRPVVTTSLGAEGLEDLDLAVADDAEGLADACARLLADPGDSANRNRKMVEAKYAVEKVAADFLALLAGGRAG